MFRCTGNKENSTEETTESIETDEESLDMSISNLSTVSVQSEEVPRKKARVGSFRDYFDHISTESKAQCDLSLAKFFFSAKISPELIQSKYLEQFIHSIRPSYKLPTPTELKKDLLNQVYDQILKSSRPNKCQDGTLMLKTDEKYVNMKKKLEISISGI